MTNPGQYFPSIRYRDSLPEATINNIKDILCRKLGLALQEECTEPITGCFSARVNLPDSVVGTNGKGMSPELAMASAYAEFMERIQNQMLFEMAINLSGYVDAGYEFSPDEQVLTLNDYREAFPTAYDYLLSLGISYQSTGKVVVQPFCSVLTGKIVWIPAEPLGPVYGSNGMCAGNNIYEALVQGISEIIERHVMFTILKGGISLPNITASQLAEFDHIQEICNRIAEAGYGIKLKNASHIFGIPTVCAILIDKTLHSYHVRWGVHPHMGVALERAVAEVFQRKTIKTLGNYMVDYSYGDRDYSTMDNFYNAFRTGTAYYPGNLFVELPPDQADELPGWNSSNNRGLLKLLLRLVAEAGYDILIRDVSFLGFPSFRVIVPGLSEVVIPNQIANWRERKAAAALRRLILGNNQVEDAAARRVLGELVSQDFPLIQNARDYLKIPLNDLSPLSRIPMGLPIAMLCFKTQGYAEAYSILDRMIAQASADHNSKTSFHRCLRDLIGAMVDGHELAWARRHLAQFYNNDLLKYAIDFLESADDFFQSFFTLDCWECNTCQDLDHCHFFANKDLVRRTRELYRENCPDQGSIMAELANLDIGAG